MSPRLLFRAVAIVEAVTWVLLIAGMFLRYVVEATDLGVRVAGPAHGLAFLAYCAVTVLVAVNQRWHLGLMAVALLCAAIPVATVVFDRYVERHGRLEGPWRRAVDSASVAEGWPDRVLRFVLARPGVSALVGGAMVVAVFSALLVMGPPRLPV